MKLYVAGPMTGIKYFNAPAFADATFRLRLVGYEVFNPAENDIENGFDVSGMTGTEKLEDHGYSLRQALKEDLTWICERADALALLFGWEKSKGAAAEIALAHALGIPVKPYGDWIKEAEATEDKDVAA
ncbi:DUF4406 domain-containing protein [Paenarthrobacter nicotinovorans]|uniref:DUF4406 domain-containing protein n=1 Tax=Paenarthrobacter nicotinovorans TaxID=29320 RepID=UPI00381E3BCA